MFLPQTAVGHRDAQPAGAVARDVRPVLGGRPLLPRRVAGRPPRQRDDGHAGRGRHHGGLGLLDGRDAVAGGRVIEAGLEPETYFDSSAIIIGLVLLGPVARGPGQGPDDRRDPAPGRRSRRRRRGASATASRRTSTLADVVPGDLLRVRPGDKRAGRRRGGRGRRRRSTSRCSPASRCRSPRRAGDEVIGATLNTTGSFVMRATRVGPRHGARADRRAGRARPGLQGADPAARRPGQRGVRAAGARASRR